MKGQFFQKPLEYSVDIHGESWHQGQELAGTLQVRTHGTDKPELKNIGVHLCFGAKKKVHAKDPKALTFHESQILEHSANSTNFSFKLPLDAAISDNTSSFYLLCGDQGQPFQGGLLELKILPDQRITDFIGVFEQFYQFKFKSLKSKKGYIQAAVTPPDSKDWLSILKMDLQMTMIQEELKVIFNFTLKKMNYASTGGKTIDEKLSVEKTLSKKEYLRFGAVNQEGVQGVIDEVLALVKLKPFI